MASPTVDTHGRRLIAVGLLAILAGVLLAHTITSGYTPTVVGRGHHADSDGAVYFLRPVAEDGDHVSMFATWWETQAFLPIFEPTGFYVVQGQVEGPFDPAAHEILFGSPDDPEPGVVEVQVPPGGVSLVWVLEYNPGWAPSATGSADGGLLDDPTPSNAAHERDLQYINAFLSQPRSTGFPEPFAGVEVAEADALARQRLFIVPEVLLIIGAVGAWAWSIQRKQPTGTGETEILMRLVQRGHRFLQAQLRLHVLTAPALVIAALFGIQTLDTGVFYFYDPTGRFYNWIIFLYVALWLTAVALWAVGLWRVIAALRHYRRHEQPALEALVAQA